MTHSPLDANELNDGLTLVTLGQAGLWRTSTIAPSTPALLAPGKPLALVAYLACAPARTAPRDHLATLLWSADDHGDARHALRQIIHRLRQLLGPDAIRTTRDTAQLAVPCQVDRERFLTAIERGTLEQAMQAYGGPFLPALSFPGGREFDEWVTLERAALSRRFQVAGLHHVQRLLSEGRTRDAIALARRIRDDNPFEESSWRPLLEALAVAGDRVSGGVETAALVTMLAEADCEPAPPTRALMARLQDSVAGERRSTHGLMAELVGREREFSAVLTAWETVRHTRHPHHLHVWGDAGVGKTRLLEEATRRLIASGVRAVRISALEGDARIPWSVLARLARALADCPGARGVAPECARQLVELDPALSAVFRATPGAGTASDAHIRVRGLAVADLLGAVAHERALVVVLDDVHWFDTPSRDALPLLLASADLHPVLLLTAGRREVQPLTGARHARSLQLTTLDAAQLEGLLGSIALPPSSEWSKQCALALYDGSGGVPLLAMEGLQQAIGDGLLELADGEWRSPDPHMAFEQLRRGDALRARIEALSADDNWLMLLLAVAGRPAPLEQLVAHDTRADTLRDAAQRLIRDGLVVAKDGFARVAHDLMAAHVVTTANAVQRSMAHRALGRVLAQTPRTDEAVQLAIGHFAAAGSPGEAASLAAEVVAERRARGDTRALDVLLTELHVDSAETWRAQVHRQLPWSVRWPRWRRAAVAAAGAAAAAIVGLRATATPHPPPLQLGLAVGAGDSLRLVRLEVDTTTAADGRPLRVADGVTIATLRPRTAFAGFPRFGPHDAGIVLHKFSADNGDFDVYRVRPSGELVRLTATPGDDIDPDWAPDGRQIVFQTARWTGESATTTHLAILDVKSGMVRRLTSGAVQDGRPRWSPDGTRIAFLRRSTTRGTDSAQLCWVTVRGDAPACHASRIEGRGTLHTWVDEHRVIAGDARTNNAVVLHDLNSGIESSLATGLRATIDMSPDQWAVGWGRDPLSWEVRKTVGRGGRVIISETDSVDLASWWPDSTATKAVRHVDAPATALFPTGVPLAVRATIRRVDGSVADLPPGVVQWSAASPGITVHAGGTRVQARDTGRVMLRSDVGGWLVDSVEVRFTRQAAAPLLDERWSDTWAARWQPFGNPLPTVATAGVTPSARRTTRTPLDERSVRALLVNGDNTFVSGILSRVAWPLDSGMGVEFMVTAPVHRDAWQRLQLELVARPRVVLGGAGGTMVCGWHYPAREEPDAYRRAVALLGDNAERFVPPLSAPKAQSRHRVRLQWFPDGSCGVAVDGRAVARGLPHATSPDSAHVVIGGQSVGTRVAVLALRVWRGVADGVKW